MEARHTTQRRLKDIAGLLACLLFTLLAPSACARLEVGIEGTPATDVATQAIVVTQATVAALAAENAELAAQVAKLQTAQEATLSPTAPSPTETAPTPTQEMVSPTTEPPASATTPTAMAEAHAAPPTATPMPPTPIPPTTVPATPIPVATQPVPVRIVFEPLATSATIEGDILAGDVDLYVLRASAGQLLEVSLPSYGGSPRFTVYGSDGTILKSNQSASGVYRGNLPSTQDYFIRIESGGAPANYTLSVVIPQRIEFQPGATCADIERTIVSGRTDYYVLKAMYGQLLDASVYTAASDVRLVIYGADGTVLKSGMGGGPSYRGTLPRTQDYIMHVTSNMGTGYRLNVTIPERISFASGATSATVQGSLAAYDTHHYVLQAMAGQELIVRVSATGDAVRLVIYGVDGTVLRSGMAAGMSFSGRLPTTQDYLINLTTDFVVPNYTMTVTIPAVGASNKPTTPGSTSGGTNLLGSRR